MKACIRKLDSFPSDAVDLAQYNEVLDVLLLVLQGTGNEQCGFAEELMIVTRVTGLS